MALYTKIPREKRISKFLFNFLTSTNDTIAYYGAATYFDKECTKLHCGIKKWRGFDDILELTKTYYPSITPKKLMHILITMPIPIDGKIKISKNFGICASTGILRFMFYRAFLNITFTHHQPHNSKYNWKQLFELLNIKDQKDIINYKNSITQLK